MSHSLSLKGRNDGALFGWGALPDAWLKHVTVRKKDTAEVVAAQNEPPSVDGFEGGHHLTKKDMKTYY